MTSTHSPLNFGKLLLSLRKECSASLNEVHRGRSRTAHRPLVHQVGDRAEVAQAWLSFEQRLGEAAREYHWLARELVAWHETANSLARTRYLLNFLLRMALYFPIGEADLLLLLLLLFYCLLTLLPVILFIYCFLAKTIVYKILTLSF